MKKLQAKKAGLARRKRRVRAKIFGTAERPRLTVHRTNANMYAQVIDDASGRTLCSASTLDAEFRAKGTVGSNKEAAEFVGSSLASALSRRASPRSHLIAVAASITVALKLWQTVPATRA